MLRFHKLAEEMLEAMPPTGRDPLKRREHLVKLLGWVRQLMFPRADSKSENARLLKRVYVSLRDHIEETGAGADESLNVAEAIVEMLPTMKRALKLDAEAALQGDPATIDFCEVIHSYPSMTALMHHRFAHELYKHKVSELPRAISELAHSETGIDIHPGARIGTSCFIDHGTGVVIGETAVIGDRVRLYQGVTLGAKRFKRAANGELLKGEARHPIVQDDVTLYAHATVLGRITIGKGSVIGGNVWVTSDVAPYTRVLQSQPQRQHFEGYGDGI